MTTTHAVSPPSIRSLPGRQATISVAMCTCNGAQYLAEQLSTIAAQTRPPHELVVADDCSTDATPEMLAQFAATSSFPVRILRNLRRLGSTANFDQVIRLCEGDYIALADQDDRWMPGKLERLGALLDDDPGAAMVFSDATLIGSDSRPTGATLWGSLRFPAALHPMFLRDAATILLQRPVVTGATMLFRRSLLRHGESIPSEWVHDGWITWMSVLWARAILTPEPLTEYRIHVTQQLGVGESTLSSRSAAILRGQRALYAQAARELDLLRLYHREHLAALPAQPTLADRIAQAVTFFQLRAESPAGRLARVSFLWRLRAEYRDLFGPMWRTVMRDLMMR